jgi:Sulfatase
VFRRVLICAAFATCCFMNFWAALARSQTLYFLSRNPARTTLPKVMGWEIGLTVAMLAAWEVCRRHPRSRSIFDTLFLVACLFPAGIVSAALAPTKLTAWLHVSFFWPVVIATVAAALSFAARHTGWTGRFVRSLFLWSWPALAVVVLQCAATTFRYRSADYLDSAPAARLGSAPRNIRVVWIIFDELSQTVAFGRRPRDMHLANLDRLKEESFYATAAFAPAGATLLSMPSLILGEDVVSAEPDGPSDLRLHARTRPDWFSWKSARNVFDGARDEGFNTAVVGWYHPYSRLLNRSLTDCFWTPTAIEPGVEEGFALSTAGAMLERGWLQTASLPLVGRSRLFSPRRYQSRVRIRDFNALRQRAFQASADASLGLVLLHLPVPHPPGIYNRQREEMDPDSPAGYIDNVALADRTLGDLRRGMEAAGVWNRTALIVSADHGWRTGLWRGFPEWTSAEQAFASIDTSGVPFLVKLPEQSGSVTYEKPFDTVVTRTILTAILQEHVTNARQICAIIDEAERAAAQSAHVKN